MLQYMLCLYISLRDSMMLFSMTALMYNFEVICRRQRSGVVALHASCRSCAWAVSRAEGVQVLPRRLLPCTAVQTAAGAIAAPPPTHLTWKSPYSNTKYFYKTNLLLIMLNTGLLFNFLQWWLASGTAPKEALSLFYK